MNKALRHPTEAAIGRRIKKVLNRCWQAGRCPLDLDLRRRGERERSLVGALYPDLIEENAVVDKIAVP